MPKPRTSPTLYDSLKTISISNLRRYGCLKPNQLINGTIILDGLGTTKDSISIKVNTKPENPHIELEYEYNKSRINYQVQLVSFPSNLGKGIIWVFICPHTGRRCRKLYLADTYFYHRSAFEGCMYEKQTQSKRYRMLEREYGADMHFDNLFGQLYKKHFKKMYSGKPTKRYLQITGKIEKMENRTPI